MTVRIPQAEFIMGVSDAPAPHPTYATMRVPSVAYIAANWQPTLQHPPPGTLPYGKWTMADSTEILFSRGYTPMWQRSPDGVVTRAPLGRWFKWVKQEWLYEGLLTKAQRERCQGILKEWGVA